MASRYDAEVDAARLPNVTSPPLARGHNFDASAVAQLRTVRSPKK
jgi:hypothetical protein